MTFKWHLACLAVLGFGLSACFGSAAYVADPKFGPLAVAERTPGGSDRRDGVLKITKECVFLEGEVRALLVFEESNVVWDQDGSVTLLGRNAGPGFLALSGDSLTLSGSAAVVTNEDWDGLPGVEGWVREPSDGCQADEVWFVAAPYDVCCDE